MRTLISTLSALMLFSAQAQETYSLNSPDRNIKIVVQWPPAGSSEKPQWSVMFGEKLIATNCAFGLQTSEDGDLMVGATVLRKRHRSVDERIPVLFGKSDFAENHFSETSLELETRKKRRVDLILRCYNDAVAARYVLAKDGADSSVTITDENTSFRIAREPVAYVQYLKNHRTSHEHPVIATPYREIQRDKLLDLPMTFSWSDGMYAAVTEASLRQYAGMALMKSSGENSRDELVCKLTPHPDGTKVVRALPMETPWRVLLIGNRPGALLESETIYCLNDPPVLRDTSWIKPGKLTFSWWNGDVFDGKPGPPILSQEMARKYIDFCASNNIAFHALTSTENTVTPWYHQSNPGVKPGPDTDVTRPRAGFDLPAIHQYAESKNVRLWTWVHQAALRGRLEEAFTAFEKMGWAGMMVDFFDHDDQDSVEFAESILDAAARHHILINLHGVWKPTGRQRTYPNLMNHEGALNLEYLKWSDKCTPEHDLNLAFTRLIAGPMDYHLGGFRALPRDDFKPRNVAPNVLGTRCHALAMYVCFDNPSPMVADFPAAYEGQPGFDFLKLVPTWWDETKILIGQPGEILVTVRRKGKSWYLGGLSAKQSRSIDLSLTFLPPGDFTARIWKDALESDQNPNRLIAETANVRAKDSFRIKIAVDGGFVVQLVPTIKH